MTNNIREKEIVIWNSINQRIKVNVWFYWNINRYINTKRKSHRPNTELSFAHVIFYSTPKINFIIKQQILFLFSLFPFQNREIFSVKKNWIYKDAINILSGENNSRLNYITPLKWKRRCKEPRKISSQCNRESEKNASAKILRGSISGSKRGASGPWYI